MKKDKELQVVITGLVLILAVFLGGISLIAWIFQLIWNWLVPGLFGGPTITFWQSVGVNAILSIVGSYFKADKD